MIIQRNANMSMFRMKLVSIQILRFSLEFVKCRFPPLSHHAAGHNTSAMSSLRCLLLHPHHRRRTATIEPTADLGWLLMEVQLPGEGLMKFLLMNLIQLMKETQCDLPCVRVTRCDVPLTELVACVLLTRVIQCHVFQRNLDRRVHPFLPSYHQPAHTQKQFLRF